MSAKTKVRRRTSKRPTAESPVAKSTRDVALVTGASAGIGAEIARNLARRGFELVLVARSVTPLRALARECSRTSGRAAVAIPCDLTRPDAARRLLSELREREIDVDTLVNNAGVLQMGAFADISLEDHRALVDLNIRALLELTHVLLEPMLEVGRGRLLNVASMASFQPVPSLAAYAASKAFVLSFSEALAEELRPRGITVTALCPGITDTSMFETIKSARADAAQFPEWFVLDAVTVAAEGVDACLAGEVICVPGRVNELMSITTKATPRRLLRRIWGAAARRWLDTSR